MVPVPVPTFEKLCFRFLLLKSYGSSSGSENVGKNLAFFFFTVLLNKQGEYLQPQ